jgi:hypothetical protein
VPYTPTSAADSVTNRLAAQTAMLATSRLS